MSVEAVSGAVNEDVGVGEGQSRPTPTVEDYLAVIYTLARDGDRVIGRKLADWLEVSAPTVTATIRRMIRGGWVTMAEDKSIHLTPVGGEVARSVIRRHMLTELLLARVLGIPWSRVHEEADRLEHGFTVETAERVTGLVENTSVCPHGNPLPGYEGIADDLVSLADAIPGCVYVLARVHEQVERNPDLMAFLEAHSLLPGAVIQVKSLLPFNETVTIASAGREVTLGLSVASDLWLKNSQPS